MMKTNKKKLSLWAVCILFFVFLFSLQGWAVPAAKKANANVTFDSYHTPTEVNKILKALANANSKVAKLHKLAVSPGNQETFILEIGPETAKSKKNLPAVFVAANMEGTVPIASEAALYLAQQVLTRQEIRKDLTWYILAMGNPDASWRYFKKPLLQDGRNARPHNDDMDDRTDEDGVEDLDKNGIITMMRVKDPKGAWLPVPGYTQLMKKADWTKGEKGMYTLYSEGTDNDKDGRYNEDGPGGVNIGIAFPHLFKFFSKTSGAWSGSEPVTYNLFKFIYSRPEIAMAIGFGESNFCLNPPRGGRKSTADFSKIKVPAMIGKRFGFDPNRTYTMDEILEKVRQMVPPGFEITENMVASFLGLGAAVNPQQDDLKFYNELSDKYKEFLKKNKLDAKRLDPKPAKDGSFELWAYYHLGVPSFTLDFWTLPKPEDKKKGPEITPEKLESMSNEDFLALGEEKIDAFLKSSGAPKNINAKMVMGMVKGGQMNTKRMAQMLKQMPKPKSKEGADPKEKAHLEYSNKQLDGKGFIDWKPYSHPTLGKVEIGGFVPFTANTPPADKLEHLLQGQVPWIFELVGKLPRIKIARTKVDALGSGVYRVKTWVENTGYLPYPTAMGKRNGRIPPVIVTFKGQNIKFLEGKKRSLIKTLNGSSAAQVQWLIHTDQPAQIRIKAHAVNAWSDAKTVSLGGAK